MLFSCGRLAFKASPPNLWLSILCVGSAIVSLNFCNSWKPIELCNLNLNLPEHNMLGTFAHKLSCPEYQNSTVLILLAFKKQCKQSGHLKHRIP
uniref:Uncharacterized protein n=1 Tax=Rhizophora mucronata TaxID=61149 RepID=A0A2P2J574_RHIMU